jgi:protein gp37
MSTDTNIGWTDGTFNPWIGCTKLSPACDNCYAKDWDKRYRHGAHWGPGAPRIRTSNSNWKEPAKWHRKAQAAGIRKKVFCGSLCDIADNAVPRLWQEDLANVVLNTPSLDWQFLTKRPQNLTKFYPAEVIRRIWAGTTVENQEWAARRIPILVQIPSLIHWLSVEPLLEPIELNLSAIDWVIIGGESGPKWRQRIMDIRWMRSIVEQCMSANVPVFIKQGSALLPGQQGRIPDDLWSLKEFPQSRRGC